MAAINANRMDWKAKRDVMEEVVLAGGTVFGGAVRDWYIHDHYAAKFYEAAGEEDAYRYGDAEFLPEFKDRLVCPNDIDAAIPATAVEGLIATLRKQGFMVACKFRRDAKRYLPNLRIDEGEVMHHRYDIRYVKKNMFAQIRSGFPAALLEEPAFAAVLMEAATRAEALFDGQTHKCAFHLDLMATPPEFQMEPPFGALDFECNGLLMNRAGMRLSKELTRLTVRNPMAYHRRYEQVMKDILARKANIVSRGNEDVPQYRVEKMLKNGWNITKFLTVKYMTGAGDEPPYDGYCIICHEDVGAQHYKMRCCDARFHSKCLLDAMQKGDASMEATGKCVMCKSMGTMPQIYRLDTQWVASIVDARRALDAVESQAEPVEQPEPMRMAVI